MINQVKARLYSVANILQETRALIARAKERTDFSVGEFSLATNDSNNEKVNEVRQRLLVFEVKIQELEREANIISVLVREYSDQL